MAGATIKDITYKINRYRNFRRWENLQLLASRLAICIFSKLLKNADIFFSFYDLYLNIFIPEFQKKPNILIEKLDLSRTRIKYLKNTLGIYTVQELFFTQRVIKTSVADEVYLALGLFIQDFVGETENGENRKTIS